MTTYDELKETFIRRGAQPVNVSFPDGWIEILSQLDTSLAELTPNYTVVQIKVKFGGLRFYFRSDGTDKSTADQMNALVRDAEQRAAKTCEICGGPGVARRDYWTLCDKDSEGREAITN